MRGTVSLHREATARSARVPLPVLLLLVSLALLGSLVGATSAAAEVVGSASGRYDTVVLRDLGGRTAALVSMVAEDAFAPQELWRSDAGAYDMRKAKFVAGDVNGDGIGDGIVLYNLGKSRSRLDVFISDGQRAVLSTAWTSKAGGFAWSRARLAAGDLNRDGLDDVVILYDRGHGSAVMYRFLSNGTTFAKSTGWSARRGTFCCARAQLAAGDVTGDGRDDAVVLYKRTTTASTLYVFATTESKFTKQTFWQGDYAAARAKLSAGDADSDGKSDAVCLFRKPDDTGRLDVFRSTGTAFERATWYDGANGALPAADCRFAAGDVTGDGRADAVIVKPTGTSTCSVTTCVSTGSAFEPHVWWTGAWTYAGVRLGVTPSGATVVSDDAKVLDSSSLQALRRVSGDLKTRTFAGETAQLGQMKAGDVLVAGASPTFPTGLCRKIVSTTDQNGKFVVTTADATLADVIDRGEVAFSKSITAADLSQEYVTQPGVRLRSDTGPFDPLPWLLRDHRDDGFGFDLATKILDTDGQPLVKVTGSVWLNPNMYVDWDLEPWGLESASITQTLSTTTDLTVSIQKAFKKEVKQTIYKQTLAVITIMVGPVPVVVTPEFEVYVGASGEVTAGVTAGVSTTTDTSFGVSYDGDHWHPNHTYSETVTWTPPTLFGALELKGFAGAGLAFKIYAVAGPEAKLEAYLKLVANTDANPWWTLSAGLEAEIGFKVEAFGYNILEETFTIPLFDYPIDWAGKGGDPGGGEYQTPSIRGKILDVGDGEPVGGATVEVRSGAPPGGASIETTHAAADGSYGFFGLAAGQYTVAAWREGYADNNRASTVVAGSTTMNQNVLLAAYENQGATGRVITRPGGAPLSGVYVGLREGTATDWSWPDDYDYSSVDGSYEFTGLEPGAYWASASGNEYFGDVVEFTVTAGHLTTGQDLHLVPYESQGLSGTVVSSLSGLPIAGAKVELHDGLDSPASELERSTTTAADGTYAFSGVWAAGHAFTTVNNGEYTITAGKTGYLDDARNITVVPATITPGQDLELAPVGLDNPGRSVTTEDFIRWAEGAGVNDPWGDPLSDATYEFWFKPATGFPGHVAMTSYRYGNWPGGVAANHCTMDISIMAEGSLFVFGINENDGGGPGDGTWHYVVSDTVAEPGHWYHIAAECGYLGMKLFINGHLEASDPYTGAPEADRSDGTLSGGWFSLGDNENAHGGPASMSAIGAYRELRVSYNQRYSADFTPPDMAEDDWHTVLLDHLIGGTTGDNNGFVWVP